MPRIPINLNAFIQEHKELLKPPVGNKMIWQDGDFMVMVVGGPNQRKDFHVEDGEEFFYQVKGDISVQVRDENGIHEIPIKEGEIFLLPARVPHSPQRPAGTVGLVIERQRRPGEVDHLRWYCDKCGEMLHNDSFVLEDLGKQLKPLIEAFFADQKRRTCKKCGTVMPAPKT